MSCFGNVVVLCDEGCSELERDHVYRRLLYLYVVCTEDRPDACLMDGSLGCLTGLPDWYVYLRCCQHGDYVIVVQFTAYTWKTNYISHRITKTHKTDYIISLLYNIHVNVQLVYD